MQPLSFLVPIGALDAVERPLTFVILGLVLVNLGTRYLAHQTHVRQAENGDDEALEWYTPHVASTAALLAASFLFTIIDPHGGIVLTTLVLGAFVTDFFEFEARRVEVRNDLELEKPKSSLTVSVFVLLYASFQALFFVVSPFWNAIV